MKSSTDRTVTYTDDLNEDDTVEIPAEWNVVGPCEQVSLPLQVSGSGKLKVAGWCILPLGLLGFFGLGMFLWGVISDSFSEQGLLAFAAVLFIFIPCFALMSAMFGVGAIMCFLDAMRSSPFLIIDKNGAWDMRLTCGPIPWQEVVSAEILYAGGEGCVRLTLQKSIRAKHNPFRLRVIGSDWIRASNEVYVPVAFLNVRARIIAQVMVALVKKHGGQEIGRDNKRRWDDHSIIRVLKRIFS